VVVLLYVVMLLATIRFSMCAAAVCCCHHAFQVAGLINCSPDEVCFTSCGTESDNWALWGAVMVRRGSMQEGQLPHVVTSQIEHPAVTACLRSMADMVSIKGPCTKWLLYRPGCSACWLGCGC
jgi:hypothetical protein